MSDPLQSKVSEAIAVLGLREAARRLGIPESSALRLASGCSVRPMTRRLADIHAAGLLIGERAPAGVRFE